MERRQLMARLWLIVNDPEAADFWVSLPLSSDFVGAVQDNIDDFGPDRCGLGIEFYLGIERKACR